MEKASDGFSKLKRPKSFQLKPELMAWANSCNLASYVKFVLDYLFGNWIKKR